MTCAGHRPDHRATKPMTGEQAMATAKKSAKKAAAKAAPAKAKAAAGPKIGDKAPDFTLPTDTGSITLSQLKGKAVVVYF